MAVAASLSRGLGGQLALVQGGSAPVDPAELAAVAVQDQATLIVISAATFDGQALAMLAGCPVVVVPGAGPAPRPLADGPIVFVIDRTSDGGSVARQATRLALELGATLRLAHIGLETPAGDLPAISRATGATLLVVGTNGRDALSSLLLEAADVPVMLIPTEVTTGSAMDRGQERS